MVIHNDSIATDLSELDIRLSYYEDGILKDERPLALSLGPKEKTAIANPYKLSHKKSSAIRITFSLKEDRIYAGKGYEIAHSEIFNTAESIFHEKSADIIKGDVNYGFKSGRISALVDRTKGHLISFKKDDEEMFISSPFISTWRAPTDNDKGWSMPHNLSHWAASGRYARCESVSLLDGNTVESVFSLLPDAKVSIQYTLLESGRLKITMTYHGKSDLIPEFGMGFVLAKENDSLKYLGLGPKENMRDRKEGALFGIYGLKVSENMEKYITPQESGVRCSVKWAETGNLKVEAKESFILYASNYTSQEVENAGHIWALPEKNKTVIKILKNHMGVGGDNSWGALPQEKDIYRIEDGESLTFYIS